MELDSTDLLKLQIPCPCQANGTAPLGPGPSSGLGEDKYASQDPEVDFFLRETELSQLVLDETSDTWGQSFLFVPINLATIPPILLCVYP